MNRSWQLPRRTFLRGACGTAMALPMLDVMAASAKTAPPCRMAVVCTPIGKNLKTWIPKAEGADYELPETLKPIADFRKDFSVLSGLSNPRAWGGHLVEGASFLTCADILSGTPGYNWKNTISMDQMAAEHLGHHTRLPSLELKKSGSGSKQHSLSWSREGVAQSGESDPAAVFDRLFVEGTAADKKQLASLYRKKKSILDLVRADYKRLESRVGTRDKQLLDQYATAVREVEKRVKSAEEWSKKPKPKINLKRPKPIRDGGVKQRGPHMRAMMDLMVLAMQTDSTRILTYALCDSGAVIPEAGVKQAHHGLSHHGNKPEVLKELTKVDQFHVKQLGYFLKKLKDTPDGDSNLLNNSMVLYGSGLGDGSRHSLKNLPILLAGHARGKLKQGFHHKYDASVSPLANLYVLMLQKMGMETDTFADSKGTLNHLT
jgi:hypothetical protein